MSIWTSHAWQIPRAGAALPQPRLERLLGERAGELGADICRGREVVGASQTDATVTTDVRGPDGLYRVKARYLVGCDGAHSRVRDMAGIPFPGTTYPEVNRLGQVTLSDSVARLDNGDLDVPGLGRVRAGFTRTDRGVFGFGALTPEILLVSTTEDEPAEVDDDAPMPLTELQDSIRRVLGANIPLGEPIRLSRIGGQPGYCAADGANSVLVCQVAAGCCSGRGRPFDLHWPLSSSAIASSWGQRRACPADPLAVRCERGLDLGFFQKRSRGAALDRLEPSQLGQRDDRGCFAAEVDHLIGLVRDAGRLRGHAATVPGPPGHRDATG